MHRVGQNHILMMHIWYVWQGIHQMHSYIQCIYIYIRFKPTLHMQGSGAQARFRHSSRFKAHKQGTGTQAGFRHTQDSGIQAGFRHTSRVKAHKRGSGTQAEFRHTSRVQAHKRGLGTQAGCRHKSGGQAQSKRKQIANSGTQAGFRRKQSASRLPTQAHKKGSGAIRAAIANADRAQHSGASASRLLVQTKCSIQA